MRTMLTRLAHRGPDGEGIYAFGEFTLGHRRLSIIDLVSGDQPMFSADRRYVIVYNGEIYNYYYTKDGLLIFASEYKAILCHPKVRRKPNYGALHDLVNLRYVLHPHTLIESIHHLPPGHYMIWENGRFSIKSIGRVGFLHHRRADACPWDQPYPHVYAGL